MGTKIARIRQLYSSIQSKNRLCLQRAAWHGKNQPRRAILRPYSIELVIYLKGGMPTLVVGMLWNFRWCSCPRQAWACHRTPEPIKELEMRSLTRAWERERIIEPRIAKGYHVEVVGDFGDPVRGVPALSVRASFPRRRTTARRPRPRPTPRPRRQSCRRMRPRARKKRATSR